MTQTETASQKLSKSLFGQVHRLDLMIAMDMQAKPVNLSDLAATLGVGPSALQAPLRSLTESRLVRRATIREVQAAGMDLDDIGARKWYVRDDKSLVWDWIKQLRTELDQGGIEDEAG